MINSLKSFGWVPSDVLVRTAITSALDDLRKNPFLLDYIFQWFASDDLTNNVYGETERQRAKKWFLNTEIFILMNYRADDPKFPCVSVGLQSSVEDLSTLGDVNYDTQEEVQASDVGIISPLIQVGPFTPKSYDPTTGIVVFPDNLSTDIVFVNQILTDVTNNVGYVIRDVLDESSIKIDPNLLNVNLTNSYIAPIDSFYVTAIESCLFKQTFSLKCFAQSEPVHLLYLHTIIEFILFRYKELLLEGRGFDRSTVASGPVYIFSETEKELTFGRDITLTGYVRQYFPKSINPKIQGFKIHGIEILGGTATPVGLLSTVKAQGWGMPGDFGEIDSLGIKG